MQAAFSSTLQESCNIRIEIIIFVRHLSLNRKCQKYDILRLNCRTPCHLFACHWIRIASIVLCFVLQRTPTNENNGGTEWRGIQQLLQHFNLYWRADSLLFDLEKLGQDNRYVLRRPSWLPSWSWSWSWGRKTGRLFFPIYYYYMKDISIWRKRNMRE